MIRFHVNSTLDLVAKNAGYPDFHTNYSRSGHKKALTVLLENGVLQGQVIAAVYQQLVFQMLRRMEVFARRRVSVTPSLEKHKNPV